MKIIKKKVNNNNYFEPNDKISKLDNKLNGFNINQRLNCINNLYTINKNKIYFSNLAQYIIYKNNILYNNDKNIENLNQIVFYNNYDNNNYNYNNILHLIKRYEKNVNIENNNKDLLVLKDNTKHLNIYKKSKNIFINKKKIKFRIKSSKYRGITKIKKKWQVYILIKGKNTYLGSYSSETIAAKVYDIMAIKNKGNKAITNFKYDSRQINEISNIDININNILYIVYNKFI